MMVMLSKWRQPLLWILRVNSVFIVIDFLLLLVWAAFLNSTSLVWFKSGYLSMMLLLEAGLVFLAGGLVAMSSSIFANKVRNYVFHSDEKWSVERGKKTERKANLCILTGGILFIESLIFALLIP